VADVGHEDHKKWEKTKISKKPAAVGTADPLCVLGGWL